jgi:hypothetical protein
VDRRRRLVDADVLEGRDVLDRRLGRLGRRRRLRRGLLPALGLPLGGFGRTEELRERALTHAGALSRH